jgi:hypothetical protein
MTISEFCKKYNLHDSLIECISYDKEKNIIIIGIDFCYWQQDYYTDGMKETGNIRLIFSEVLNFDYMPYSVNSDEILSVGNTSDDEMFMEVYNDVTEKCYRLTISAKNIDIIADEGDQQ